jgi:DNA polymerase III sliding clamp (beta) subunit (PCNA family)
MNVKNFCKSVVRAFGSRARFVFSLCENTLTIQEHYSEFSLSIAVYESDTNHWSSLEEFLLDAPDFTPSGITNHRARMDAKQLREALSYCLLAVDTDSTRWALGGILWDNETLVATDGRRMHYVSVPSVQLHDREALSAPIIPAKSVKAVLAAMKTADSVSVEFTRDSVFVYFDEWTIKARLLEGRFPSWREIIPTADRLEEREEITFVKELRETLKERIQRAKLWNKSQRDQLRGVAKRSYNEEPAEIVFDDVKLNARYVLDAVSNMDNKAFKVKLPSNQYDPVVVGNAVIMPMK